MRKVVVFIISCILSFSSFAQGDVEWGEQKMYEDFDQFVEIINNYNPQIEIRKHVCNYDIIAELRKRRPAIDTIKSYGEFVNFMSNNVKIVCDIHTKMFIFLSHDPKIWSEILSDNVLQIDTTRHFQSLDQYKAYEKRPLFSFGIYLLYQNGHYNVMGNVNFSNAQNQTISVTNCELVKVGGLTVDEYLEKHPENQKNTLRWDYELKKFYSTSLSIPYTELTFRNLRTSTDTTFNLENFARVAMNMPILPKKIEDDSPRIYYFQTHKMLYIRIPLMSDSAREILLKKIKKIRRHFENVVLDVRGNRGGGDDVWMDIISVLIKDTIQFPCNIGTRSSFFLTWNTDCVSDVRKGPYDLMIKETDWNTFIPNEQNCGFIGQFFVLQDWNTLSAAHSLSSICRLSPHFTSIGVPTGYISGRGGTPVLFQLKNSGFVFTMECNIDASDCLNSLDFFQDIPEHQLHFTEEEAVDYFFKNCLTLKDKKHLLTRDPYMKAVFELVKQQKP